MMILLEANVKVPGKMFRVKVQCVATRRLTTMEWLIINCASKFRGSAITGQKTLKYVFEEVFQLTSSEILIKPCIESLIREQTILLDVGPTFDYSSLTFSQIRLTDKGTKMAEDGLFPGEPKEIPLDIYYNPLTGSMNQFSSGYERVDDAIEFGTEADYETSFPEDRIIEALHKGLVGHGKFVASRLRIESIECLSSSDWENCIKLEVNLEANGRISTKPVIKEASVKPLITSLFFSKEISANQISQLVWIDDAEPKNIIGSGKKIKESILDISRNGSLVGINYAIYSLYKRNTTAFKEKAVLLWGAKELGIERSNGATFISLPFEFEILGCVIVNEKNESVSICKAKYDYDGTEIIVPVAIEDKQLRIGKEDLVKWIETIIQENYERDLRYIALYTLPILIKKCKKAGELLKQHWKGTDPDTILADLRTIFKMCNLLETEMIQLENYGDELWKKFSILETADIMDKLGEIMQMNCVKTNSSTQRYIFQQLLLRAEQPKTYNELFVLLQSVGIKTHSDALLFDDVVSPLYTREIIIDVIRAIVENTFTKLPELFELDIFFNDYVQAIKEIDLLISGFHIFEHVDKSTLENSIEKCSDVALLQSYSAEIISKNAALLGWNVNVYSEMKETDADRAENFFNNLNTIKQKVALMVQADRPVYTPRDNGEVTEQAVKTPRVYILDTCALINHPDILLCFNDEEFVRIPTKVIDELGKIKDMRSTKYSPDLSRTASRLAYDIERKYLRLFNANNKMRLMIENSELELLPIDLDKSVPDNQILSVALKYKDWETFIISDDGVFRLASIAQNLKAITSEEFLEGHHIYRKSLERWTEKYNKTGRTLEVQPAVISMSRTAPVDLKDIAPNDKADIDHHNGLPIDNLPIKELKKYLQDLSNDQIMSFLQNNKIMTIGDFRKLTSQEVDAMPAKGKQSVYKNTIKRALEKFSSVQSLIKL